MKTNLYLICVFLAAGIVLGEDTSDPWTDWLSAQATPKVREVTTLSADGQVQSVVTTREYDVHIKQVSIEERTLGEDNRLRLTRQRRSTDVRDAHGGRYTLREESSEVNDGLSPVHVIEEIKTPASTVVTVQTRDARGQLTLNRRTTSLRRDDGATLTTVETRDADGNLVVTERRVEW